MLIQQKTIEEKSRGVLIQRIIEEKPWGVLIQQKIIEEKSRGVLIQRIIEEKP